MSSVQTDKIATNTVMGGLNFLPADLTGGPIAHNDLRQPASGGTSDFKEVSVLDASQETGLGLHVSGFELVRKPSATSDFYDHAEVMKVYYSECKALAQKLTGAHTTYTFDHIIREPQKQFSAGGTDGSQRESGISSGGGYIGNVHMDYTDNTTWDRYLALHGETVPAAKRVYALNFWRPLSVTARDNPLAVCDARTVSRKDLLEVNVYGYGAENYSWHDIGIETFSVSASDAHKWFYYPDMTPDDVLVIKSYDSEGVIGTTCPHGSFSHPQPVGIERKSIELRVLCFCD
ncbi:MAG: hypothetical protein GKR90_09925 [Pseudomonadales bacterium]|nr:hypothetical protein [Pseudomonadales bacterium]